MKITKILVALSFLFGISTANAGELTVTGSMEATYMSETQGANSTTGNPLGTDRELKFSGSTELDNGITVSVYQDTTDSLGYGDNKLTFGGVAGILDIYVGADGSPVDAIDDVTPTAYEEANGSGSGTLNDIGDLAGEMGIGFKFSVPFLGSVDAKYIPKADNVENADNNTSGATRNSVGDGQSIAIKTNLSDLPFIGGALEGATLTTGYETIEIAADLNTSEQHDATVALNYATGPIKFGIQRKFHDEGQTVSTTDAVFYKDLAIGLAYTVNDSLSISFNRYTSKRHNTGAANSEQETDAFNIGYTLGGMTIGFQDATTDNAGWSNGAKDDTRTLGVSVAF